MTDQLIPSGAGLARIERFLRMIYERRVNKGTDAVVLVIGGEGSGKSTLMLQMMMIWENILRDHGFEDIEPESLFEKIYSTRHGLQQAFVNEDRRECIAMPDAGRALFRKEAMDGDQREVEKDFFDVRFKCHLILLGFQDWRQIPDFLSGRRGQFALFIPRTGTIWGFSRSTLDDRDGGRGVNSWPDPDMVDRFPSLEGTDLWKKYENFDAEEKIARMGADDGPAPEDVQRNEKIKAAIRAVKIMGLSQQDAGRLVGYSQGWVSDRLKEFDYGDHDDLFDNPPKKTAVQQ